MRVALAVVALAATVAAQVQTITQIGDGQIQAPPATATSPEYTTPTAPAVSTPEAVSSVPEAYSSVIIVPSSLVTSVVPPAANTSSGAAYTSPVVPVFTTPAPSNGSASASASGSGSGSGSSPSSTASASGASGTPPPESNGAAANMVSFGGLVVALGAVFLA